MTAEPIQPASRPCATSDGAVQPPKPWRCYEVNIDGFGPHILAARSASAARYSAYLDFSEAWSGITFREFQQISSVRVCGVPASDGYDYIRRAYGVDVKPGDRVELQHEGARFSGRQGSVVYPGPSTAHVRVVLDGEAHASPVHPLSIRKLGDGSTLHQTEAA